MRTLADFRPYQHRALAFCQSTPRGYLAAKAGAGKTGVALAYIEHLMVDTFEVDTVLIVAPKRVVPQWAREARKWASGRFLRFAEYVGTPSVRSSALAAVRARRANVLACSFEFLPELVKAIQAKDWPFGLVVFDEASRLRQGGRQGSVSWKAMNAISRKTGSRLLLMSGSPRPGTAHELFAPVLLLDHGKRLGDTLSEFRSRYLEPNKMNRATGQVYSWKLRQGMEQQLYGAIGDLFFAVAPDLGLPSVVIDRPVELPQKLADECRELQEEQIVDLDELEVVAPSQGVVAGKLHQICQGAVFGPRGEWYELHSEKLDELEEVLDEIDGPAIVCVWYEHDRERVARRFPDAVDITTEEGLAAALRGDVRVAVLHPASAGHGIDGLQDHFADIIWFAVPASFELYDQANKRIIRSGQKSTVRVWRIIATNGIVDQRIVRRLAEKEAEQDEFFRHLEQAA